MATSSEVMNNNFRRKGVNASEKVHLIAGLGNPGLRYKNSRHNIGFMVLQDWAKLLDVRLGNRSFSGKGSRARVLAKEIILLCPQTYMNESGRSIKACADYYRVEPENILIVHDDIDLDLGKIKVIKNGGSGGHKGVLSVFQYMGTRAFGRVKIGVGRPRYNEPVDEFVLSPFYKDDQALVRKVIEGAVKACELFVGQGLVSAMDFTNRQNFAD
jgi:PTH1 family peptidyl-tRNA hydrolase